MSETTMNPRRRRIGGWSHFPIWLTIAMGLVFAVNARFIYVAVTTFPGTPTMDDFDTSNDYNKVLSAVDRQNALGWQVRASDATGAPAITLTGKQGQPLAGASIEAIARRPLGNDADVSVTLAQTTPGRFELATGLRTGQWDLLLHISADGHEMRVTRRVIVR